MGRKAPTACKRSGCPGLVRDGVCSVCGPLRTTRVATYDDDRGSAAERGYDHHWRHIRQAFLKANPLCVRCEQQGTVAVATDIDHIVPKRWGGKDIEFNLQALCHECHSRKTQRETRRGRWTGDRMARVILVGGPPGAGKTRYVSEHMSTDDVVLDVDALAAALTGRPWYERTDAQLHLALDVREFLLLRLKQPVDVFTAWVITSAASPEERADIAAQCGAVRAIMVMAPFDVCMARIRNDPRRSMDSAAWYTILDKWFRAYRPHAGEQIIGAAGV